MIYMNNKEEQIKVYVMIGTIVMLLVIFSGITYAFFSASNNKGSTSVVEVKSGKMTISYADGKSSLLVSKDIQPSDKIIIDKTFTLTGTNTTSGLAMPYKVGLNYVSEFSEGQIHYYIKRTNTNTNVTSTLVGTTDQTIPGNTTETGYTSGTLKKGNRYLELATGEFKANTSNQTITFNLKIQFPDTGVSQDSEKGKTLTGEIVVNSEPQTIVQTISNLDFSENGLEIDDTADKNIRYVGTSPKNYITFNNESWRIIGVFNVYNNETNQNEDLVKIVRNASISNKAYNTNRVNGWKNASLNTLLNEEYYSTISSKKFIANVSWNIGNVNSSNISALESYNQERTNDIWNGKIGLIYPSDYGYASTDTQCRKMIEHNGSTTTYCKNNNWLHIDQTYWSITSSSKNITHAIRIASGSGIYNDNVTSDFVSTRPTLFLKSNVQILEGDGSSNYPYIIN